MQITIKITDAGDEMVQFEFDRKSGDNDNLAVYRASARMELAISQEYAKIHAETQFVKKLLGDDFEEDTDV